MLKVEGNVTEAGRKRKVIFQCFSGKNRKRLFPYPPLYREPDTEYFCFTDDARVHSSVWKVQVVEELAEAVIEPYLEKYNVRLELQPDQIQMGELLSGTDPGVNLLMVPSLSELPLARQELEKTDPTSDGDGNYIFRRNPVYSGGKYGGRPIVRSNGLPPYLPPL